MTMDRIALSLLALIVLSTGCAQVPFQPTPLVPLTDATPRAVRDEFGNRLAEKFTAEDTVIIHAPFRPDMALLTVLRADRAAGTFDLLGLSHVGVQLFHLSGDDQQSTVRSAIPALMKHRDILLSIADDVRRMHFDLRPAERAHARVSRNTVRFTEKTGDGNLIHVFGGSDRVLLEKRLSGWFGNKWRVRYYEYASAAGKLHPDGIVVNNGHYHYRITVKNRSWQAN